MMLNSPTTALGTWRCLKGATASLLAAVLMAACGGASSSGSDGGAAPAATQASLTSTAAEPAGVNCVAGGVRTQSGPDTNGNGVLDSSEVNATSYACIKVWRTATLIETDDLGSASEAQVAVDASGNALAIWAQHMGTGTPKSIWSSRYTGAGGWAAPVLVETDDTGDAELPQITIDGMGNALTVWLQESGGRRKIWANRYTAAGWGAPVPVESINTGSAGNPQIAIDANGNGVAVWSHYSGRDSIWANRYAAGAGWGTAELIETNNVGDAYEPQIAIDANGNALAVWYQSTGGRFSIWSNRLASGAGWGTAVLIETDDTGDAGPPQIAMDANGNALAVWRQADGTPFNFNIWSNRYTAGTGWGTAVLIESDSTGTAYSPQIAFDGSGNALAVWSQFGGAVNRLMFNRYTAGVGWGSAAPITANAGDANNPQITATSGGNAVAVWEEYDGTRYSIWSSRYTAGTGWETAVLIETDNAQSASSPQLAIDADGNAIGVWVQLRDGTGAADIWANVFK